MERSKDGFRIPVAVSESQVRHCQPGKPLSDALGQGEAGIAINNPKLIDFLKDDRLGLDPICSYADATARMYGSMTNGAEETRRDIFKFKEAFGEGQDDLPGSLSEHPIYSSFLRSIEPVTEILILKLSVLAEQGYITARTHLKRLRKAEQAFQRELDIKI